MSYRVLQGDCRTVMADMPPDHYHACVTDPPYELAFMGRKWDKSGVAFDPTTWAEVLRVLRPGAHLVAFGGSRTFHRMAVAIEDAGFEIRDTLMWLYGSGFPKSLDVSKAIDKAAGAEREVVGSKISRQPTGVAYAQDEWTKRHATPQEIDVTAPATDAALQWNGFGTALKPAFEPIILARKPLDGTVASNVLKWSCGALNIDGCRVDANGDKLGGGRISTTSDGWDRPWKHDQNAIDDCRDRGEKSVAKAEAMGRWPANVLHDGSEEVVGMFPETTSGLRLPHHADNGKSTGTFGDYSGVAREQSYGGDSGSAARFFWSPKAAQSERPEHTTDDGRTIRHPTVKPLELMRYLVKLVTPPGGTILEPFAGSGATVEAAWLGHWPIDAIELDPEHIPLIHERMRRRSSKTPLFNDT